MPKPPVPPALAALLAQPNPAVIGTLKPGGSPHTVPTWYLWEDGRVLVSMDHSRKRVEFMRDDPRVSLSVMDARDWLRHVSLRGRVVSLTNDDGLVDIDRIARHYTGAQYPVRDRERVSAWIEVTAWHGWEAGQFTE